MAFEMPVAQQTIVQDQNGYHWGLAHILSQPLPDSLAMRFDDWLAHHTHCQIFSAN